MGDVFLPVLGAEKGVPALGAESIPALGAEQGHPVLGADGG